MFDDDEDKVAVFLFDDLANQLLEQGSEVSPSEIHGCFSGMLASGASALAEVGLDGATQALEMDAHGELASHLMQLYRATDDALRDEEFGFQPVLPDDDDEIEARTAALVGWCRGFLTGVAHTSAQGLRHSWSGDAKEILEDIAAMTQAEVSDEEDEDEAEGSFLELVEYLRMGVLNLFTESVDVEGESDSSYDPSSTLH